MSYADDFEDIGGYFAEQDFYAEECEDYDGECRICPHKYECPESDYRQKNRRR